MGGGGGGLAALAPLASGAGQPGVPMWLGLGGVWAKRCSSPMATLSPCQDSYPRFLKSDLYKNLLAEALIPPETKKRCVGWGWGGRSGLALPERLGAHLPPSLPPRVFPFMWKLRRSSPSPALLPPAGDHEPRADGKSKAEPLAEEEGS